jgi:DNA-binding NtrC family response regulator
VRFCHELKRPPLILTPEAIQAITCYHWPGNIRELENAIQRAVILCESDKYLDYKLLSIDLDLIHMDEEPAPNSAVRRPVAIAESNEDLSLEDYFQRFVLEHQDSMSETELARKLGVSRKCLWERRQRLGIPRSKGKTVGEGI